MAIRKEQVLFLVTIAFGAWMYTGLNSVRKSARPRAQKLEYASPTGFAPITVDTTGPTNLRELFIEPSESRPLPPRSDLPFIPLPDVPVVLLPLEVGQQPPAYYGLRSAPLIAKGEQPGPAKKGGGGGGGGGGAEPLAVVSRPQQDPSLRYDRLVELNGINKFWGLFLGDDKDKFRIASNPGPFPADEIKFQWIDPKTNRTVSVKTFKGANVSELKLAKTLRNEVGMRLHKFVPSSTNAEEQRQFIYYLLEKARLEPWVYEKALERAATYMKFMQAVKNDEEGILYQAKVLRAMGDLAGEYKLFRDLDKHKTLKGSSFQARGLGIVEAKLGLDKLAEEHLERAVAINQPIDPRNYAALATFYLDRGRGPEAVDPAQKAVSFKGRRNPTAEEQIGFHDVLVRAMLAVGDLDGAEKGAAKMVDASLQTRADYQAACIAYAKKDPAAAEPLFQQVFNTGRIPDALLGIAACQLAQGKLTEGMASLDKIIDEQPRLRHLGLAGKGLALMANQGADALETIEAGIVTYPNHPYLLYLQGRQKRLNGDLEGAIEPLKKALQLHDDFLEALAELTVVYHKLFRQNSDAQALISAIKYVDRLADLDQVQGEKLPLFLEMQGQIHYEAGDLRGARAAFARGEEQSAVCKLGLAMVEYAQKRQDLAELRLQRLIRDLPPASEKRKYADHLRKLMIRHGNKEQVVDKFDRLEIGKSWKEEGGFKVKLRDGEMRFNGKLRRNGPAKAKRLMVGPGRFLELQVQMKIGQDNTGNFTGVGVQIEPRGAGSTRFRVQVGMDDRGELVLETKDGRKKPDPLRTGIKVTRDEWHTVVISVDDADDADMKNQTRYLKVFFDGQPLHDPAKPTKLMTLRRSDTKSTEFSTELLVSGNSGFPVDVAFRNYRRIQEKSK